MSWMILVWFFSAPEAQSPPSGLEDRYLHISKAGAQPLAAVAVAAVICVLVLVVVFTVAQLVIQLRFQAILHELGNGLL